MNNDKQIVKIQLDYLQGPIWMSDPETGEPITGIDIIDNDSVIVDLNHKAGTMFNSYYEFDSHGAPCWFNSEKEKLERNTMLDLISQIKERLEEINDGSFVVEDLETERLNNL